MRDETGRPPATDRTVPFELGEEQRYPLDLAVRSSPIRSLYEAASRERWDPERAVSWDELSQAGYSREERRAAALVWSHRAWLEYRGIRESETAVVRLCIERGWGGDVKFFLASRATAKALATETAWLVAGALDSYLPDAPSSLLAGVLADDTARRGLHARTNVDAFVLSQIFVADVADLACAEATLERTAAPVLRELLGHLLRDKRRHVAFGREYARWRLPLLAGSGRLEDVAISVEAAFEREVRGLRCPSWLADARTEGFSSHLVEAYEITSRAGLGAVGAAELGRCVMAALEDVVSELSPLGVRASAPSPLPIDPVTSR